jgi:hypothetical protein
MLLLSRFDERFLGVAISVKSDDRFREVISWVILHSIGLHFRVK